MSSVSQRKLKPSLKRVRSRSRVNLEKERTHKKAKQANNSKETVDEFEIPEWMWEEQDEDHVNAYTDEPVRDIRCAMMMGIAGTPSEVGVALQARVPALFPSDGSGRVIGNWSLWTKKQKAEILKVVRHYVCIMRTLRVSTDAPLPTRASAAAALQYDTTMNMIDKEKAKDREVLAHFL